MIYGRAVVALIRALQWEWKNHPVRLIAMAIVLMVLGLIGQLTK